MKKSDNKKNIKKNCPKKNLRKFSENRKFWSRKHTNLSKFQIFRKSSDFHFRSKIFFGFFLLSQKNNIFSELKKKLKYSFDVKNWELSIYEVFRAIPTLCRDVGANIWHQKFKNQVDSAPGPLADFWGGELKMLQKWWQRSKIMLDRALAYLGRLY